jgi:hypothetical protein
MKKVDVFVDSQGKIKQLPRKVEAKQAVLSYLAQKFSCDKDYTEKEVNNIIDAWHTFGDYFLLRRELVDHGFLSRLPDGSRYWKEQENTTKADK